LTNTVFLLSLLKQTELKARFNSVCLFLSIRICSDEQFLQSHIWQHSGHQCFHFSIFLRLCFRAESSDNQQEQMEMKPVYISQEQHDKLHAELHQLKYTERPQIISAIAEAREHGDLRENAEYAAAKEKQVLVERKINRLEEMLSRSRVIESDQISFDRVHVGRKVKLVDIERNEEIVYEVVPSAEFLSNDLEAVSVDSLVGKALVGKAIGEIVEIKVPVGILRYRVTEIS